MSPSGQGERETSTENRRKRSASDSDEDSCSDADNLRESSVLSSGPRKRPSKRSPLVHHGRHFGRTIQAFCRIQTLLMNGMARSAQLHTGELSESDMSRRVYAKTNRGRERREHDIYKELLRLSPSLEEKLCNGTEDDIFQAAELGSSSARADDTKGLKGVIIDWITPPGVALNPPLSRNVKTDRGFFHNTTGQLLCPVGLDWSDPNTREGLRNGTVVTKGDQWAPFLYKDFQYDIEDIWKGLFRSQLLVSVVNTLHYIIPIAAHSMLCVSRGSRNPSGNARIHGMTSVTIPSLAYVATQVRFALSSSPVFSKTDLITDSETFYTSVIETFYHPGEKEEVDRLLEWWNRSFLVKSVDSEDFSKDRFSH
ncbi:hypothetical protein BKA70DRAFT_1220223 [Coprinopsis sp. MPI-PUGE-AT-0042]|nr:hypothetical protein BKA70DRAFT_1220223 [Coprinopsis sp. MPI-PUGE-AT-0042]